MTRTALRTPALAAATLLLLSVGTVQAFAVDEDGYAAQRPQLVFAAGEGAVAADGVTFSPTFDGLIPGRSVTNDVVVHSSSDSSTRLDLTEPIISNATRASAKLEDAITLTIVECDSDVVLYSGPLTKASFSDLRISAHDADGVPLEITATLDDDAPQDVSGQRIDIVLTFSVQQM